MKKIITMLLVSGTFSLITIAANAQALHKSNAPVNRNIYNNDNDHRNNNAYYFNQKQKSIELQKINDAFAARIKSVYADRTMRRAQKKRLINQLEDQRNQQIALVNQRFNDHNVAYNKHRF